MNAAYESFQQRIFLWVNRSLNTISWQNGNRCEPSDASNKDNYTEKRKKKGKMDEFRLVLYRLAVRSAKCYARTIPNAMFAVFDMLAMLAMMMATHLNLRSWFTNWP